MPTSPTISNYNFADFLKVLKIIETPAFLNAVKLYNNLVNDNEIREYISEKKKGFFEKYKTVENVKVKIASLEKAIQDQAKMIDTLNKRNIKLGEFILKHSISERITTKDLVELTDEYKELFQAIIASIDSEIISTKVEHDEIDLSIKLLNEPPYEDYYNN